jgi:hypothetical protein
MKHRNLWGLVDSERCHHCHKKFKPKDRIVTLSACLGYSDPPVAEDRCWYHEKCYEENKHKFMTKDEIAEPDKVLAVS